MSKRGRRLIWHQAPNRVADGLFLSLTPTTRMVVRHFDEMLAPPNGVDQLRGNLNTIANWLALDRKNARQALEAIARCGILHVEVEDCGKAGKFFTITKPQETPKQAPTMPQATPEHTPSIPQADPEHAPDKSANNAGSSDLSLGEREKKILPLEGEKKKEPRALEPQWADSTEELLEHAERLCAVLADAIEGNGSKRPAVTVHWLDGMALLMARDKRPPDEIEDLIRWAHRSNFWEDKITAPDKLMKHWDKLRIQAQREKDEEKGGPRGTAARAAGTPGARPGERSSGQSDFTERLRAREQAL